MSKRIITYTLIGLLLIIAGGAITYGFTVNSKLQAATSDLSSLNVELQAALSEVSEHRSKAETLSEELSTSSKEVEDKNATISDLQSRLSEAESQWKAANDQLTLLEDEKAELTKSLRESSTAHSRLASRIEFYECDDSINMDYSGVMAASSRLMAYVDGLPGVNHTSTTYRDTIWSNADTKIYGVRYVDDDGETYSTLFLVYFTEFGMEKGVFSVDRQCWLDSPVN
jgi:flagellar biosynthesis chaperone FliJ